MAQLIKAASLAFKSSRDGDYPKARELQNRAGKQSLPQVGVSSYSG